MADMPSNPTNSTNPALTQPAVLAQGDKPPMQMFNAQTVPSTVKIVPIKHQTTQVLYSARKTDNNQILCASVGKQGSLYLHPEVKKKNELPPNFHITKEKNGKQFKFKRPTRTGDCTRCVYSEYGSRNQAYQDGGNGRACHWRRIVIGVNYEELQRGNFVLMQFSAPPTSDQRVLNGFSQIAIQHGNDALMHHYVLKVNKVIEPYPGFEMELDGEVEANHKEQLNLLSQKISFNNRFLSHEIVDFNEAELRELP